MSNICSADVVVVGSGHNGLVAGCDLAKADHLTNGVYLYSQDGQSL